MSKSARRAGLTATTTRQATATWLGAGMVTAPVLVAGFSAAALRVAHGYVAGIVGGVVIGAAIAVGQLVLLHFSPWGRDLVRVWLDPVPTIRDGRDTLTATLGLWSTVHVLHGAAVVLAARSIGVTTATEAIVAIAIGTYALAALTPSPGGLGAIEVGLYVGLAVDAESAVLAVIVARVATFWLHMPMSMLAHHRALREDETGGEP
jgi:undecaprenyl-diphosphatase